MAKSIGDVVGRWAFLIGVILAVLIGILGLGISAWVLVLIGIIVGLLNVADREVMPFLLSGLTLVLVGRFGGDALASIPMLKDVLDALMVIFVPATVIVAVKNVWGIAKH
jgi:hypothetical protein